MGRSFLELSFLEDTLDYDGTQLSPHWIYKKTGIMGDAAVSFIGACNIPETQIADIEDLVAKEKIQSDSMLHFIIELFTRDCLFGSLIQTVFISELQGQLLQEGLSVVRRGDDLFIGEGKLSISVASCSAVSSLIHIGINIRNDGTPVKTSCLSDHGIDASSFAKDILKRFNSEFSRIILASSKVKPRI